LRVVLDTNVLIRAHTPPSIAAQLLVATRRPHRLVISNEILVEVVRVLRYPRFQKIYGHTDQELLGYRQYLQSVAESVELQVPYAAPLRDASDLMVLQTADVGRADLLVTADPDFYGAAVLRYCEARHIDVCDERMALARLL
jgi:putative PIN family toxin of toxin-antitoxin system